MKTYKKILIWIFFTGFFGIILLFCAYRMFMPESVFSDSMSPTFNIGDIFYVNTYDTIPDIGDAISFQCLANDSICGGRNFIMHRLTDIDSRGCMVIIGDNPSYDWSSEPCYMPEDIEIIGVVHKYESFSDMLDVLLHKR